ncbi:MAG: ribulose-phosphate 3-epimerase [Chloroflexi bacterium]|nr:ribulose-phosphate 3-epimerase [Chloroflexota bacterium]
MIQIAPSMASAPFLHLADVIQNLEAAGADAIHFDIEDGTFVPMMTLGTRIIGELRPLTRLPFDVHLMVRSPEWIIPEVISAGANWVSVHYEACPYPHRTLRLIRRLGARAGLAFNPKTPLPDLRYLRRYLDFVLILTTEPEYPDADFLPDVLHKVSEGQGMLGRQSIDWAVDGGITPENVGAVVRAGANVIVAGRSVFRNGAIAENLAALRAAAIASVSI